MCAAIDAHVIKFGGGPAPVFFGVGPNALS